MEGASTAAPEPYPAKNLKILLTGDVMLGRLVDQLFPVHNDEEEDRMHALTLLGIRDKTALARLNNLRHKYVWGDMLPTLRDADVKIINLETSVTTHPVKWPNKAFNYRMHPDNLQALKEIGVHYASLANNHSLDFCEQGMLDTMEALDKAEIAWAGVGSDRRQAETPAGIECKGRRIAVFSFADHPNFWSATDTKPGINFIDVMHYTPKDIHHIKMLVQEARDNLKADLIIFSIHWGSNYCWVPPVKFQRFAHELIDTCGVDILHGHSSHHVQGIQIHKGKPIIYGCGDFVDDYAVDEDFRNNLGFAYFVTWDFENNKVDHIELVPTHIELFCVNRAKGNDRKWLSRVMKGLCLQFKTDMKELENGNFYIAPPSTH